MAIRFRVMIEEVHSCMGGDESVSDSEHESIEAATLRCQEIVRESLDKLRQTGSSRPLIDLYDSEGVQPFILPIVEPVFIATEYARQLLAENA